MEKYLQDTNFRKLLQNIYNKYKIYERSNSYPFTHYEDNTYIIKEYYHSIDELCNLYEKDLATQEFLDSLVHTFAKSKIMSPVQCILKIASLCNRDIDRLEIVRYVLSKFSVEELESKAINNLNLKFKDDNFFIKYIQLFCYPKFTRLVNTITTSFHFLDSRDTLVRELILSTTKTNQMIEENQKLREKIQLLNLEINYMPGGEGYQESKKHFESCL